MGLIRTTLPIAYSNIYNGFICCRNNTEFASGIAQPNLSEIEIGATNHSDYSQYIFGLYWFTVGY